MLHEINQFKNYTICSADGTIGKVRDFLFDDQSWEIRYLVVDTGNWLVGKKVLITPDNFIQVSDDAQCITVNLTRKQIEESPPLSSHVPVDRQKIKHDFFILPDSPLTALPPDLTLMTDVDRKALQDQFNEENGWDPHLRSSRVSTGSAIEATDGEAGRVADFVADDQSWIIRYMVVNTSDWWPGHQILVAPPWISRTSWGTSKIFVQVNRKPFMDLEEFTSIDMLTREYETRLHQSCNRIGYWADDPACNIQQSR